MNILAKIFMALSVLAGFFLSFEIAEVQRQHLSVKHGNNFLIIEGIILLFGYIGYKLWQRGKYKKFKVSALLLGAGLCIFFG